MRVEKTVNNYCGELVNSRESCPRQCFSTSWLQGGPEISILFKKE